MKKCSFCQIPASYQRLFQFSMSVCFRCYSAGLTQTTFENIVSKPFVDGFKNDVLKFKSPAQGNPCGYCSHATHAIPIKEGKEKIENLKIFAHWRHWYTHHRNGSVQILYCPECGGVWMNARTLCQLPIDWLALENHFRDLWKTKQEEGEFGLPADPLHAVAVVFYGIPSLENTPRLSEMPYGAYFTAISVIATTKLAFQYPNWMDWLRLDPSNSGTSLLRSMVSYSWVHSDWAHCLGNLAVFLVFAPLIEHELEEGIFLSLLLVSALGGAILQTAVYPTIVVGFSGVVSAFVAFFCCRFPSAVIGMGAFRLAAPTALLVYIGLDIKSTLELLTHQGNTAGLCHLGGAAVGYFFHVMAPLGQSSRKFKKMASQLVEQEKAIKNWNK